MNSISQIDNVCSLIGDIPHSLVSGTWKGIFYGFSQYWYLIIPGLVLWIGCEVVFRNKHDFNSDNGFTPIFNSFIGAGLFLLFSTLINSILHFFLGGGVSCGLLWVKGFYLIPFIATGLFLHRIGFWPYIKLPILNEKLDLFGSGWRPKAVKKVRRKWRKYR